MLRSAHWSRGARVERCTLSSGARGREVHVSRGARCRTVHVVERRTRLRGAHCRDVRDREARGTSSEQSCCGSTRNREVATSFPVFFSFGFMCKCLWEAPVGIIIESSKCCRVFARSRVYFYTALSFVCCKSLPLFMCH